MQEHSRLTSEVQTDMEQIISCEHHEAQAALRHCVSTIRLLVRGWQARLALAMSLLVFPLLSGGYCAMGIVRALTPGHLLLGTEHVSEPAVMLALAELSIAAGSEHTGTVTLGRESAKSVTVSISSSAPNSVWDTPSMLTIPAGQKTASFTYYGIAEGDSTLFASAAGYSPARAQVWVRSAPIPASLLGLSVLDFTKLPPSVSFGTARSWDAWPDLDWADANPSRGTYNFTYLDKFIAINQARGAEIIYTLGRTPRWASSKPDAPGPDGLGECAPPADMSDYENYLTAIVTHAGGRIKYWELWNEPQDASFYCGDIPTMVTMAQDAARIIRGIDPDALILSPGVTGGPGPAWLSSFLSEGGAAYVDIIAFHGYWSAKAEDLVDVISSYRSVMAANHMAGKPLWDTEASWAGFGKLGTPSNSTQVGFIAKYYLLHWSMGVPRFVWYAYDGGPIWGGLWNSTTGESPAAKSYHETYRWIVGATLTSPCSANKVSGIWTCPLSRPGGYLAEAVWISDATATYTFPASPRYTEYLDLAGAVHTLADATVTVGEEPILLENGSLP
jgi:polysaccharide biosynthesis protein PslG